MRREKGKARMKIVVPCKVVADDQDIVAAADGSLDFSKAKPVISTYDLNAIECAAQLSEADEATTAKAITVCNAAMGGNTKLRKDILARGVDELYMTADDAVADLDAFATAAELAKLVEKAGGFDLIICGDGSADLYAKQTGVQLAAKLDVPYLSEVVSVEAADGKVVCKRMLASEIETVEVPLPAVIAVSPDVVQPRIAGMKQILAAGKKPQAVEAADAPAAATVETVAVKAPEQADRACKVFEDVNEFVAAVKAAL